MLMFRVLVLLPILKAFAQYTPSLHAARGAGCFQYVFSSTGKVKFTLEQATKAEREIRGIVVLFL